MLIVLPRVSPEYYLSISNSEEDILNRTQSILEVMDVQTPPEAVTISIRRNYPLIRDVIHNFGKRKVNNWLSKGDEQHVLFYWDVSVGHRQTNWVEISEMEGDDFSEEEFSRSDFRMRFSPDGALLSFQSDSLSLPYYDSHILDTENITEEKLIAIAKFHLEKTIWHQDKLQFSSFTVNQDEIEITFLRDEFIPLDINVRINNDGSLNRISYDGNELLATSSTTNDLRGIVTTIASIILGIFILITFFRRQFDRLIDMRLVKLDAFAIGLLSFFILILILYRELIGETTASPSVWFIIVFVPIVTGLITAGISMLVLGTADSLTEEASSGKKHAITLLRHGYVKNDIVGFSLTRGLAGGLIMIGLATLIFAIADYSWFSPLESSSLYTVNEYAIAPLYGLAVKGFTAILMSISLVMIPGAWLQLKRLSKFWIFLILVFLNSLFLFSVPLFLNDYTGFISSLILVAIPVWFYLKYDVLTVITTYFVYGISLFSSQFLILPGYSDVSVFLMFLFVAATFLITGYQGLKTEDDLSKMPDLVPEYLKRLAREQRIEKEFELAKEVQDHFLTSSEPNIRGFDIAASCKTAYEVGGDYYDFIALDDKHTLIIIADVSGKGVKAAFYMTLLKGYLQAVCKTQKTIHDIIVEVNRLFYQNSSPGTFITALAGILNSETQTFEYVRAGHDPLYLHDHETGDCQKFIPKGFALGMADPDTFEKHLEVSKIKLTPEKTLLLFTDGYAESTNIAREQFGEQRLENSILRNANKQISSGKLAKMITEDVKGFTGSAVQHDDMTIIIVQKKLV